MSILKEILYKVAIEYVTGSTEIAINQLHFDSRKIEANDVFVAIRGTISDGHDFIEKAIGLGATAVICDTLPENLVNGVTYICVKDTNAALAFMAANFYGNPSQKLKLVGITGTNGKTTIATLLYQLFGSLGHRAGLISTVEYRVVDQVLPSTHTTPDPIQLNLLLNK